MFRAKLKHPPRRQSYIKQGI